MANQIRRFGPVQRVSAPNGADGVAAAANKNRVYFLLQNVSAGDVHVNFGAPATTSDLKLAAGERWEPDVIPTDEIHLFGVAAARACVIIEA